MFSKKDLKVYNGQNGHPMYLAILGQVFDVTKGERHYGEEGPPTDHARIGSADTFGTGCLEDFHLFSYCTISLFSVGTEPPCNLVFIPC